MPKKKSEVDERIDRGEVYISPTRPANWGRICGAKTRHNLETNGGFCQYPAGYKTNHVGEGRCHKHGGVVGARIKHGRYSTVSMDKLQERIERYENDPDPLDMLPDLAISRALFERAVDNFDEMYDALLNWHRNYKVGIDISKPTKLPDLDELRKFIETITNIVSKIEKIRSEQAVSRQEFLRVMTEIGRIIQMRIEDEDVKQRVISDMMSIRLQ